MEGADPSEPPRQQELVENPSAVELEEARAPRHHRREARSPGTGGKMALICEDRPTGERTSFETFDETAHIGANSAPRVLVLEGRRIDDDPRRRGSAD